MPFEPGMPGNLEPIMDFYKRIEISMKEKIRNTEQYREERSVC